MLVTKLEYMKTFGDKAKNQNMEEELPEHLLWKNKDWGPTC